MTRENILHLFAWFLFFVFYLIGYLVDFECNNELMLVSFILVIIAGYEIKEKKLSADLQSTKAELAKVMDGLEPKFSADGYEDLPKELQND